MKRTTRILCLLLALCCMIPMLQNLSLQVNAYASAKPLPELTGNKGQDVANVAISQLGYREDSSGGTVYGAWWTGVTNWGYDYTRAGWCSIFAMWCAEQAGAGMDVAFDKRGAVPANCMSWLLTNASGDTTFSVAPAPGDFIFFSTGSTAQHVAIVVAYDRAANKVTFVGGNQGNAVTQFTMSYTASALYGSQRIIGIGRPNYGESVIVPACECDEAYAGFYRCITESDPLNMRGGHGTAYSVVGTIPSGATVYVSKAQGVSDSSWAHVEYNGIKGYCSMQYLKRVPEYSVEVIYDDHTGNATGANVEVFDYVTVDEMTLTLPEQFSVTDALEPLIHVSAKNGFLLNLEIPLSGDRSHIAPVIIDAIGQSVPLEEYVFTEVGIRITFSGTADLQLIYQAPQEDTPDPGISLSGVVTSFGGETEDVTLQLIPGGETEPAYTATVQGNSASYTIKNVEAGSYTLRVSKTMHTAREYTVIVGTSDVTQNAEILLYGDVTGDGLVNSADATQINRYFSGKSSVITDGDSETQAYRLLVANVYSKDNTINATDATQIKRHFSGKSSVFTDFA